VAPSDFVSRGQGLVAAGQYQEAVKICRLGLLGRPTAIEGRIVLGQALLALRRYDEVLAEMRVALELDANSAQAHLLRGEALLRKGDAVPATEALARARQLAPGNASIAALLAEAEIARDGASTPGDRTGGLGYVDLGDSMTKHYPSHQGEGPAPADGGSYTRPTKPPGSMAGKGGPGDFLDEVATTGRPPAASKPVKTGTQKGIPVASPARGDATPPPHVLSVGDRSGTVEVDPEMDGIEVDDDIGAIADPPSIDEPFRLGVRGGGPAGFAGGDDPLPIGPPPPRGKGSSNGPSGRSAAKSPTKAPPVPIDDDDDVIEMDSGISLIETPPPVDLEEIDRAARLRAMQRRSVGMPSGPIGEPPQPTPARLPNNAAALELANRPTAIGEAMPPNLRPPTLSPVGGAMAAQNAPRVAGPSAMPTVAGQAVAPAGGIPPARPVPHAAGAFPAAMPTVGLSAAAQRSAAAIDGLFPDDGVAMGAPMPSWAKNTVVAPGVSGGGAVPGPAGSPMPRPSAPPGAPTQRPVPAVMPPGGDVGDFTGLLVAPGQGGAAAQVTDQLPPREDTGGARHHRTGVRTSRRFKILLWVALGVVVIGGGVFAGFQIRRIRLDRQIDSAVTSAENAAKPDTYLGWIKARDGFAGILAARDTARARAKVALARAVLAADFGDDLAGAKVAVEGLGGTGGGVDGAVARAYIAIASGDAKAAETAAKAALERGPNDAGANAVVGRAALMGHRWGDAARALKTAVDKDPRPAYLVALAEAELGRRKLQEARGNCERSLALVNDHPATLILRARVLAAEGKLASGDLGAEVTGQLDRVYAEGQRPIAEQVVGVSTRQAADAALAQVTVQIARKDAQAARIALDRAIANRPTDQRFAEDVIGALVQLGQFTQARAEADATLEKWPASLAAHIGKAETQLVDGDAPGALETLGQAAGVDADPMALTLRGRARLAMGDLTGARTDLDAAIAAAKDLVPALVARTWVDLRAGEAANALADIEPVYGQHGDDPLVATAYAAALRQTGTPDKAREVLQRVTTGPEGPALSSAWLELGRLERDIGDYEAARKAYGKAIGGRGVEAKLEAATLYIDDGDVASGRETLEALVKQAPNDGQILVQTARVRTLLGDLAGARELIARAEKLGTAPPADLAREKARLALKGGDFRAAVTGFEAAIAADNQDIEAHLLFIDAIEATEQPQKAIDLLEPAKKRFGDKPERFLILGKVALVSGKVPDAKVAFEQARQQLEEKKRPPRRLAEAHFGLGRCKAAVGDIPGAVKELELGLKRDPTAVDVYIALGDIAAGDGNLARALAQYQAAEKYNPDYADLEFQIGRTANALGKRAVAKAALEHYLRLAPNGEFATEAKRLLTRL
jgi:tetratricopeptide (TPR) repeat protein